MLRVKIHIISDHDKFCEAQGDWKVTKAGFTAVLQCKDAVGQRRRECNKNATWREEESECVNPEVNSVFQSATIVNIGLGSVEENAAIVFSRLDNITNRTNTINTFANMKTSVDVLMTLSEKLTNIDNKSTVDDLLDSSSNLLDKSLENSWTGKNNKGNSSVAETYLSSVEQLIEITDITGSSKKKNIEVDKCKKEQGLKCRNTVFNVTVDLGGSANGSVKTAGFQQLQNYLPHKDEKTEINSIVVSATVENIIQNEVTVEINFTLIRQRRRHVRMQCVSWDNTNRQWSDEGCEWQGSDKEGVCICKHLSSFAILMSKEPLEIPGINEITLVGLSVSVMSLIISLAIQVIVWNGVVKSNALYLRHIAHVNISLCLLVGDCCFLASYKPEALSEIWCKTVVVLKHFCYLSMFFWMLCLSCTLLHQTVFMFHKVSKKNYLKFSLILGYACPFLIVTITFLTNNGAKGKYFSTETCWLVYIGLLNGSIHTFLIPIGIIIFINVFAMLVVIMKLLDQSPNRAICNDKEKTAAKTVMRTVILLTPIFGVTWIFGFGVMLLDLSSGYIALAVNYAFTLMNAFQGLFILLTTCLGDKLIRDTLLSHFKKTVRASISDTSTKLDSIRKK
ncbi:adhesion G-protein coupled receptor F3-like [Seriola lalandi dorsalis]|uniref:adhesion G-protein coupled receptor F3-like n=1 Tax=Seriola lalandi dorsalis TaxID=1841481 RepID=UPI000C6F5C65|nr:adhesion G-protein coupled receptor F3-like [Seriola lalandi dorsalis]